MNKPIQTTDLMEGCEDPCTECGSSECECDWEPHCICGDYWCDGDCY